MRAKTEELLYLLLWTAETISRPTWRNLTESFVYASYQQILLQCPRGRVNTEAAAGALRGWLRQERQAWMDAMRHDLLLPSSLLPDDYAGRRAWEVRLEMMREAGERMRGYKMS